MNPEDLPLVAAVVESGADDRLFDALLVGGVLVIAALAVVGRRPVSEAVATLYLVTFLANVAHNWWDR
ncbi:MAG: hypothetical protein ABEJ68_10925 [Halobacteriaceae archaeon]